MASSRLFFVVRPHFVGTAQGFALFSHDLREISLTIAANFTLFQDQGVTTKTFLACSDICKGPISCHLTVPDVEHEEIILPIRYRSPGDYTKSNQIFAEEAWKHPIQEHRAVTMEKPNWNCPGRQRDELCEILSRSFSRKLTPFLESFLLKYLWNFKGPLYYTAVVCAVGRVIYKKLLTIVPDNSSNLPFNRWI